MRRILALSAGLALVTALAGCASGASTAGSASSPSPSAATEELEFDAAWVNGGTTIGLVTYGSSTCVPTAESVELLDDGTLAVALSDGDADKPCTMDYVPRVTLVDVPADVDASQDLALQVTYGEVAGDEDLEGVTRRRRAGGVRPERRLDRRGRHVRHPHLGQLHLPADDRDRRADRTRPGHGDLRDPAGRPGLHDGHGAPGHPRHGHGPRGRVRRRPRVDGRASSTARACASSARTSPGRASARTRHPSPACAAHRLRRMSRTSDDSTGIARAR